MPRMPKRVKYRKSHRGKIRTTASSGNYVAFGDYGLQALQPGWITARQIEACRICASRYAGAGKAWIRIFPHKAVTATPAETRMGKGKGEPEYWCAVVKKGTILFEIGGVSEDVARRTCKMQSGKLGIKTRMVSRRAY